MFCSRPSPHPHAIQSKYSLYTACSPRVRDLLSVRQSVMRIAHRTAGHDLYINRPRISTCTVTPLNRPFPFRHRGRRYHRHYHYNRYPEARPVCSRQHATIKVARRYFSLSDTIIPLAPEAFELVPREWEGVERVAVYTP